MARSRVSADNEPQCDVSTVQQRFDLTGAAKVAIPMLLDLEAGTQRWVHVNLTGDGIGHNVWRHRGLITHLASDLSAYYRSDSRLTMLQLAIWPAAARTPQARWRTADTWVVHERLQQEETAGFATRLPAVAQCVEEATRPAAAEDVAPAGTALLALLHGNVPASPGSEA